MEVDAHEIFKETQNLRYSFKLLRSFKGPIETCMPLAGSGEVTFSSGLFAEPRLSLIEIFPHCKTSLCDLPVTGVDIRQCVST